MNVFRLRDEVWHTRIVSEPRHEDLLFLLDLARKQLDEVASDIEKKDYSHASLEFADALGVCATGIQACGFDPETRWAYRIFTRQLGKVKEIQSKYHEPPLRVKGDPI